MTHDDDIDDDPDAEYPDSCEECSIDLEDGTAKYDTEGIPFCEECFADLKRMTDLLEDLCS